MENSKRFFSKVAGATYIFPDGTKVNFDHGFLDVTPEKFPGTIISPNPQFKLKDDGKNRYEAYVVELDALCKEGNPLFFTQETVRNLQQVGKEYKEDATKAAKSEIEVAAAEQRMRTANVQGITTGDENKLHPQVEGSTVDPALQAAVFAPRTGPQAEAVSRVQEARLAAAARQNK